MVDSLPLYGVDDNYNTVKCGTYNSATDRTVWLIDMADPTASSRPSEFAVANHFSFSDAHWTKWGANSAIAKVTVTTYSSTEGQLPPYQGTVTLGGVQMVGGQYVYTTAKWTDKDGYPVESSMDPVTHGWSGA